MKRLIMFAICVCVSVVQAKAQASDWIKLSPYRWLRIPSLVAVEFAGTTATVYVGPPRHGVQIINGPTSTEAENAIQVLKKLVMNDSYWVELNKEEDQEMYLLKDSIVFVQFTCEPQGMKCIAVVDSTNDAIDARAVDYKQGVDALREIVKTGFFMYGEAHPNQSYLKLSAARTVFKTSDSQADVYLSSQNVQKLTQKKDVDELIKALK